MSNEPWRKAGGYPREDWEKVVRLARERIVNSWKRIDSLPAGSIDRVNAQVELERAKADFRKVLEGDARTVSDYFGDVLKEEGRRMFMALHYANMAEPWHGFGMWLFLQPADDPRLRMVARRFEDSYSGFRPTARFEQALTNVDVAALSPDEVLTAMAELVRDLEVHHDQELGGGFASEA